jgi:hypothetical protein
MKPPPRANRNASPKEQYWHWYLRSTRRLEKRDCHVNGSLTTEPLSSALLQPARFAPSGPIFLASCRLIPPFGTSETEPEAELNVV